MNKVTRDAKLVYALTKAYIMQKAPYIYKTVYGFIPHFVPGMHEIIGSPISVTEGMILMMDPEFVAGLTPEKFGGPIYHEVCHQVKEHLPRVKRLVGPYPSAKILYVANLAADFTINPWLRKNNWWLPEFAVFPDKHGMPDDLMFEEYFHKLMEKKDKLPGASFAGGICGGCTGNSVDTEVEARLDAQKGRGAADRIRIRNGTIRDITEHVKQQGVGTVPGFFSQLIPFKHEESITPWREELSHVICSSIENLVSGASDFSLRRPSKRSYTRGIIRPGLVDYQPEIVLIEDTSGSMGTEEIQTARNEEIAILQALGVQECWLIQADSDVAVAPQRITLHDIPSLKTHGRGGTDFRPAIRACESLEPHPDLALYLTDGYGPAPEDPPHDMEVVWVLVPEDGGALPAEWGHTVIISNDPEVRSRFRDVA